MYYSDNRVDFSELRLKTLVKINGAVGDDSIEFETDTGEKYILYHRQDCCESVTVDDICGDLNDLIGSPLVIAEESTNDDEPKKDDYDYSYTWTFYRLATIKGYVTIKWYGTSNGYYSESVDFVKV